VRAHPEAQKVLIDMNCLPKWAGN